MSDNVIPLDRSNLIATEPCPDWCRLAHDEAHRVVWEVPAGARDQLLERWHDGPRFGRVVVQAIEYERMGLCEMVFHLIIEPDGLLTSDPDAVAQANTPEGLAAIDDLVLNLRLAREWLATNARPMS